jgi:sterol desaturase/sphingolipid hydroxylase (fatty acid hydroxylase superfamily)
MRVLHDLNTYLVLIVVSTLYLLDAPFPFGSFINHGASRLHDALAARHVPAQHVQGLTFVLVAQVYLECCFWFLVAGLALAERAGALARFRLQSASAPEQLTSEAKQGVLVGHWLVRPAGLFAVHYLFLHGKQQTLASPLPTSRQFLPQLLLCVLIDDCYFYWAHRLVHTRVLYARVHKVHHQFHQPNVFATEYAHPLEDVFVNSVSTLLGPLVLGVHPWLVIFYSGLKLYQSMEAHSGYNLPFPLSLSSVIDSMDCAPAHDYHHSANVGNFGGLFMFWDWICGTDAHYRKHVMHKHRASPAYASARRPYEHDLIPLLCAGRGEAASVRD